MASRVILSNFFKKTVNSKPPTRPFGVVACTLSDNVSQNSCIQAYYPHRFPLWTEYLTIGSVSCCHSLGKQPIFCDPTTGFPEKRANFPRGRTNQKGYPDLGSDTSLVWNFCAGLSEIISRGDQWWCRKMLAFFSSFFWVSVSRLEQVMGITHGCFIVAIHF